MSAAGRDPAVQALLDKEAIREVLRRYCRGVDRGDMELIASVYHEDATDDHGIWKGLGKDFAVWIVDMLKDMVQCQHLIGNCTIELHGDAADCETYCCSVNDTGQELQIVYNRYIDRFEKRGGEWKIAHRLVVFDVSHTLPREQRYGEGLDPPLVWGSKDRSDPVYR
ncbi:MAG TPA: nuclear transport factor 2 family protein [Sphingomonas sp.]|nr:nuclear transport factor 2 family protein [Sphingomonas sp.]